MIDIFLFFLIFVVTFASPVLICLYTDHRLLRIQLCTESTNFTAQTTQTEQSPRELDFDFEVTTPLLLVVLKWIGEWISIRWLIERSGNFHGDNFFSKFEPTISSQLISHTLFSRLTLLSHSKRRTFAGQSCFVVVSVSHTHAHTLSSTGSGGLANWPPEGYHPDSRFIVEVVRCLLCLRSRFRWYS